MLSLRCVVPLALLLTGCVTTYADGRTVSTFDSLKELFRTEPDRTWRYEEFEPLRFVRPGSDPVLIAPAPEKPVDVIILKNVPDVLDQGRMPAGPIFAAGYVANSMLHASKMSSYRCSPSFLFRMLNGSESVAVELIDTLKFLQSSGCARTALVPYRSAGDYGRFPDALAVRDARNFRIRGYGRVDLTDLDQIRNHLALGRVVITSLVLPENLVDFSGRVYDEPEGNVMGRQTFALIGFDAKRQRMLLQNSMGKDWGKDGRVWIPWNWYIRMVIDAYVIF